MNIVVATIKSWNIKESEKLKKDLANRANVVIISSKESLSYSKMLEINPEYIFFPHWSWKIPKEIYENFRCIVFHMTDLPFGRGGSPLQNLIIRGIENTKISAIKVESEIDSGDIYIKRDLNLNGSAEEIFLRASEIIFKDMIPYIIENYILPRKQSGEEIYFHRRSLKENEIKEDFELKKIYNQIRMLDAEGYPNAFIRFGKYKIEFSRASLKNGKIVADVVIQEE